MSSGRVGVANNELGLWPSEQSAGPTARLIWHEQLEKLTMWLDYLRGLLYFSSA
jgi:hypothetical protein